MSSRPVMRHAAAWTVALGLLWAAIAGLLWDASMALGVLTGAAIGGLNFWLLGRALGQVMADPERFRNAKRKLPRPLLLKWPLILGMLALAVWWLPVRPEGIAMGALISLVSLMIAGLRERSAAEPDPPAPDP